MSEYAPKRFTKKQRELFAAVSSLNRTTPTDFREADQWIAKLPPSTADELAAYKAQLRARSKSGDAAAMLDVSPGFMDRVMKYKLRNAKEVEGRMRFMRFLRRSRSEVIRGALKNFEARIKAEADRVPLKPAEIVEMKARQFLSTGDPIVFDAMNPEQAITWARRLLRLVWIMTDPADLTATRLRWLRNWKWGEHALEFLSIDKPAPAPRLWLRVTIFDSEIGTWERLSRDAMRVPQISVPRGMPVQSPRDIDGPKPPAGAPTAPRLVAVEKVVDGLGASEPGTVRRWCRGGLIPGAVKGDDGQWLIPADAKRPKVQRKSSKKYQWECLPNVGCGAYLGWHTTKPKLCPHCRKSSVVRAGKTLTRP